MENSEGRLKIIKGNMQNWLTTTKVKALENIQDSVISLIILTSKPGQTTSISGKKN